MGNASNSYHGKQLTLDCTALNIIFLRVSQVQPTLKKGKALTLYLASVLSTYSAPQGVAEGREAHSLCQLGGRVASLLCLNPGRWPRTQTWCTSNTRALGETLSASAIGCGCGPPTCSTDGERGGPQSPADSCIKCTALLKNFPRLLCGQSEGPSCRRHHLAHALQVHIQGSSICADLLPGRVSAEGYNWG